MGNVAKQHIRAVLMDQDGSRDLRGAQGLSLALQHQALVVVVDESRSAHAGRAFCSIDYLVQRNPVAHQPLGLHLDLQFAQLAAKDRYFGHARDGKQPLLDRPIGKGP